MLRLRRPYPHEAKYADAIAEKRVKQAQAPYLVYCATAETFAEKGKNAAHSGRAFGLESEGGRLKSDRGRTAAS